MEMRKLLFAALAAASIGSVSVPALADVYIDVAPPPPRYEVVPPPRHGYVWAPGHWVWRHRHHVWVRGRWIRARHGYYWHPDRWEEHGGRWVYRSGGWYRSPYHP